VSRARQRMTYATYVRVSFIANFAGYVLLEPFLGFERKFVARVSLVDINFVPRDNVLMTLILFSYIRPRD